MIKERTVELATGKNFAVLTTLRSDGHPASQPMWVDADADHILINTEVHRRKFKNVLADPRVTVTIWESGNPYNYVEVRGVVAEIVYGQPARAHIDRLAMRYFGRPYNQDEIESERVILKIRPLSAQI